MGMYIETPTMPKESYLMSEAELITIDVNAIDYDYDSLPEDKILICLIDNGPFRAAGITFSKKEFEVFNRPDGRMKFWFVIDKAKAADKCEQYKYYLEEE